VVRDRHLIEEVQPMSMNKKISGGWREGNYRFFGPSKGKPHGKALHEFNVVLSDGREEIVEIGFLSSYLRPKVEAWWRANVKSWEKA
jgi:hypothetical protein